jgi:hypothetical protein
MIDKAAGRRALVAFLLVSHHPTYNNLSNADAEGQVLVSARCLVGRDVADALRLYDRSLAAAN